MPVTAGGWTPETSRQPPAPGGLWRLTAYCDDGVATNMVNSNPRELHDRRRPASLTFAVPLRFAICCTLEPTLPAQGLGAARRRHPGYSCPVAGAGVGGSSQIPAEFPSGGYPSAGEEWPFRA
jgi:hypothetical protein